MDKDEILKQDISNTYLLWSWDNKSQKVSLATAENRTLDHDVGFQVVYGWERLELRSHF